MAISLTSSSPRISVVMPVYNGEKYLRQSIDSILAQTFRDFEFIIVDDASTDRTAAILASYDDQRIVVLRNQRNIGQAAASNRGFRAARGEYIARWDSDDACHPARLQRQVDYLDQHADVFVIGTWVRLIRGDTDTGEGSGTSSNAGVLAWELTWGCPIVNSSTLMRRDDLLALGLYDDESWAEDYDLWTRAVRNEKVLAVIPEALTSYRISDQQIGARSADAQRRSMLESAHRYAEWMLGRTVDLAHVDGMIRFYWGRDFSPREPLRAYMSLAVALERRSRTLYDAIGSSEIPRRISDVLLFSAADCLRKGRRSDARRRILFALTRNFRRAARPSTLRLLLRTFFPSRSEPSLAPLEIT